MDDALVAPSAIILVFPRCRNVRLVVLVNIVLMLVFLHPVVSVQRATIAVKVLLITWLFAVTTGVSYAKLQAARVCRNIRRFSLVVGNVRLARSVLRGHSSLGCVFLGCIALPLGLWKFRDHVTQATSAQRKGQVRRPQMTRKAEGHVRPGITALLVLYTLFGARWQPSLDFFETGTYRIVFPALRDTIVQWRT